MPRRYLLIIGLLLVASLAAVACAAQPDQAECPEAPPCPECPPAVACPEPMVDGVPFETAWMNSPHADADSEAFRHWDEEDPAEVPADCAKCHSSTGYLDFLGEDGSEPGVVDSAAALGTVITCEACHNATTGAMTSVVFPSGAEIGDLGPSARCMECHQGRASGASVDAALEGLGLSGNLDTPNEELGFINIHYYAAAASLFGSEAHAGYEYAGLSYQIRFAHVEGYQECADCHNPHTLELQFDECATCHLGVASTDDVKNIRMQGSLADYDGDGDTEEGIYYEIVGLQETLYQGIQAYAAEVAGTAIVYDSNAYPYFFIDTNENGEVDEGEAIFPNRYNAWTGRLLQAAYNFQVSKKDPGAYAHNAKYHIALLYDSIASLDEALSTPVGLATAHRNDPGHFDGSATAWRYWDEAGRVPGTCAKCHSGEGVAFFLAEGVNVSQPSANSLACTSCHTNLDDFALYEIESVTFPSGATLAFADNPDSNLCLQCHQGRSSTVTVDRAVDGLPPDTVAEGLNFINIHYFSAGATLFGSEAQGAYQYAGREYAGRFTHRPTFDSCEECHSVHALEVNADGCVACHGDVPLTEIRMDEGEPVDYDGDGDVSEGIAGEIETIHEALLEAILVYAADTAGTPIAYHSHNHPYFFVDTNANGVADPDEAVGTNRYASWTPRLLRAAYNYQYAAKDPGAYAHNATYVLQVLYDSLQDIGGPGAVTGMTRP